MKIGFDRVLAGLDSLDTQEVTRALDLLDSGASINPAILQRLVLRLADGTDDPCARRCHELVARAGYDIWGKSRQQQLTRSPAANAQTIIAVATHSPPEPIGHFIRFLTNLVQHSPEAVQAQADSIIVAFLRWNETHGWASGSWTTEPVQTPKFEDLQPLPVQAFHPLPNDGKIFVLHTPITKETEHGSFCVKKPPYIDAFFKHFTEQKYYIFWLSEIRAILPLKKSQTNTERFRNYLKSLRNYLLQEPVRILHRDWRDATSLAAVSTLKRFNEFRQNRWELYASYAVLTLHTSYRFSDPAILLEIIKHRNKLLRVLRQAESGKCVAYFALIDWAPYIGYHLHFILLCRRKGGSSLLERVWRDSASGDYLREPPLKIQGGSHLNRDIRLTFDEAARVQQEVLLPLACASKGYRPITPTSKQQLFTNGWLSRVDPSDAQPIQPRIRFGREVRRRISAERSLIINSPLPFSLPTASQNLFSLLEEIRDWVEKLIAVPSKSVFLKEHHFHDRPLSTIGKYLGLTLRAKNERWAPWVCVHPFIRIFYEESAATSVNCADNSKEIIELYTKRIRAIRIRARLSAKGHEMRRKHEFATIFQTLASANGKSLFPISVEISRRYPLDGFMPYFTPPISTYFCEMDRRIRRLLTRKSLDRAQAAAWNRNNFFPDGTCSSHLVLALASFEPSEVEQILNEIRHNWLAINGEHSAARITGWDQSLQGFEFAGRNPEHFDPPNRRARCAAAYLAWGDEVWWMEPRKGKTRLNLWQRS